MEITPSQSRASSLHHGVCCVIHLPKHRAKPDQPSRESAGAEAAAKQRHNDNRVDKEEWQAAKGSSTSTDLARVIF